MDSSASRIGPGRDNIQQAVQKMRRQCDAAFLQREQTYSMPQADAPRSQSSRLGDINIRRAIALAQQGSDAAFLGRFPGSRGVPLVTTENVKIPEPAKEKSSQLAQSDDILRGEEGDTCKGEVGTDNGFTAGYLSDLSEDAEDVLSDASEEQQDVWYEDQIANLPVGTPTPVPSPSHSLLLSEQWRQSSSGESTSNRIGTRSRPGSEVGQKRVTAPEAMSEQRTLKRRRHDVPLHEARKFAAQAAQSARQKALEDIKKLLASKRDLLVSGSNSLQAYRARAIQACLYLMVHSKIGMIKASVDAAKGNMFSGKWGARLVRSWVQIGRAHV